MKTAGEFLVATPIDQVVHAELLAVYSVDFVHWVGFPVRSEQRVFLREVTGSSVHEPPNVGAPSEVSYGICSLPGRSSSLSPSSMSSKQEIPTVYFLDVLRLVGLFRSL